MTIIFRDETNCGAPIKYEATKAEYEFLCMLAFEDIIADNWNFWALDDMEEIKKREED